MSIYLFTDIKCKKVLAIKECPGLAEEASEYRERLSKELKQPIVSWNHMGGDNPGIEIK